MAESLILYCRDLAASEVSWCLKGGLQTLTGQGTLADAADLAKGRRVLVMIPAEEALITQVAIPTRNRQRLQQAIPFTLETELTQDVEQLHFAIGPTAQDNTTPVIVISRSRIEEWLESLESHGIEPLGLYLDLLSLPLDPDGWSIMADRETLQVRSGPYQGFTADLENAGDLLGMALQQAGEAAPQKLTCYRFEGQELATASELDSEVIDLESQESLVALLAKELHEKQPLNLLQGDYKKVDKFTLQWQRWLPAAIMTAAALLLGLTLNILDYYHYQRQSRELDQQIRQVFKQALPGTKRIVDPKKQMEQQLKILRGGKQGGGALFSALFTPAATIIKNSPETQLESISFRDGQLDLQLTIKELAALEKLKQAIEQKHLSVEIRAANASGDQVTSHLRISGVGQ
ncbi:MAG: type II secretion system protein GspL [Candidatus Thiodiazotropha sp.]